MRAFSTRLCPSFIVSPLVGACAVLMAGCSVIGPGAFEKAVRSGDTDAIKAHIEKGRNVNAHFVRHANLLEFGLTLVFRTTTPPIVAAAESREPEAIALLIGAGADVNAKRKRGRVPQVGRRSVGWSALGVAALTEDPRTARGMRLLLDAGADVDSKNGYGKTPLMIAAGSGSVVQVQLLLTAGADLAAESSAGRTALRYAQTRNDYLRHMISKVLRTPVRDQLDSRSTANGWTALMWAAKEGDERAVKEQLLESDVDVNGQDGDGWTALMWAASPYGSGEKVELLLEAGADPNLKTPEGWTAIMSAVVSTDEDRVRKLLDARADVNCRVDTWRGSGAGASVDEDFPITAAVWHGSVDLVRMLLDAGADISRNTRLRKDVRWGAGRNTSEDKEQILELVTARLQAAPRPQRPEDVRLLTVDKTRPSLGPPGVRAFETNAKRAADGRTEVFGSVWILGCPTDLAADILWRAGEREWHVRSFTAELSRSTYPRYRALLDGFEAERVDLVIRPNPALAVAQLKTWEIWGQEIVLDNISVNWER